MSAQKSMEAHLLDWVNGSRSTAGLGSLALDLRVCDLCQKRAETGQYVKYGRDMKVKETVYVIAKTDDTLKAIQDHPGKSEDRVEKWATHFGLGVAVKDDCIMYVECIIFKYLELDEISFPTTLLTNEYRIEGSLLHPDFSLHSIQINQQVFSIGKNGNFSTVLNLNDYAFGLVFHVQLFVSAEDETIFCAADYSLKAPPVPESIEVVPAQKPVSSAMAQFYAHAQKASRENDNEPITHLELQRHQFVETQECAHIYYHKNALSPPDFVCTVQRIPTECEDDAIPEVLVDLVIGDNTESNEGFTQVAPNLKAKYIPLTKEAIPIVDLVFILKSYEEKESNDDLFGFEKVQNQFLHGPPGDQSAYDLYYKRQGAGRIAAEASTIFNAQDEDIKEEADDLLDTNLTPEQVSQLEREAAREAAHKEAAARAEALKEAENERGKTLEAQYNALLASKQQLLDENINLQKKLAQYFAATSTTDNNKKPQTTIQQQKSCEAEKQYAETLSAILAGKRRCELKKVENDRILYELQTKLDEKELKSNKITTSFQAFKREIAITAQNSRTGKSIPKKQIQQFEELESERESQVEKIRLKNINLRMTLKKLEESLRAKEQLAEGLHLIDFEQLKIENQTLREKIHERTDELLKLKKKNTQNVQVLTHTKEKLQFLQARTVTSKQALSKIDDTLTTAREKLTKAKNERTAKLKLAISTSKNASHITTASQSTLLLLQADYNQRKVQIEQKTALLQDLKHRYALLKKQISQKKQKAMHSLSQQDDHQTPLFLSSSKMIPSPEYEPSSPTIPETATTPSVVKTLELEVPSITEKPHYASSSK